MANLFESKYPAGPLANRMRPQSLEEIVGQRHLIGETTLLRRAILADRLGTVIFYGPPGTGKTTLARVISSYTKSAFEQLNAVTAKLDQLRDVLKAAESRLQFDDQKTILFLDEIHRFNKMQQDALLPALEAGTITLIGATTENPSFEVNAALLSGRPSFGSSRRLQTTYVSCLTARYKIKTVVLENIRFRLQKKRLIITLNYLTAITVPY